MVESLENKPSLELFTAGLRAWDFELCTTMTTEVQARIALESLPADQRMRGLNNPNAESGPPQESTSISPWTLA